METTSRRSVKDRLIGFGKSLDKVGILGGLAVSLFNPVLGGTIVGGSLVSLEATRRFEYETSKSKTNKELGKRAYELAA